jgi:hypothetical protein
LVGQVVEAISGMIFPRSTASLIADDHSVPRTHRFKQIGARGPAAPCRDYAALTSSTS